MMTSELIFGWHKLLAALIYLDERSIDLYGKGEIEDASYMGDRDAINLLRSLLPNALDDLVAEDRAARWELPREAMEFLEGGTNEFSSVR